MEKKSGVIILAHKSPSQPDPQFNQILSKPLRGYRGYRLHKILPSNPFLVKVHGNIKLNKKKRSEKN